MKAMSDHRQVQQAWVVFSGQTDLCMLRFLKPGFRHCFVLLNDGNCWISIDPMSHYTEILVHQVKPDFDLPGWLEKRGHRIVSTAINHQKTVPAPFGIFSCVEAVKRILGIHALFIITPWQLYRYLTTTSKQKEMIYGKSSLTA